MEEIKKSLCELQEQFDNNQIGQKELNLGFIAILTSNNKALDDRNRIPYLIDFILNEEIFE